MARLSPGLPALPAAIVGLAGVCLVLALLNGYLLATSVDTSPILPGSPQSGLPGEVGTMATPLDAKPVGEFRETVQRPLFNATRRPIDRPKTAAPEATPVASELDMRLVGIVKTGAAPARALIRVANEPTGKWITEGESINGWKVRTVKDRSVLVESDGRSHELTMQVAARSSVERGDEPAPADKPR